MALESGSCKSEKLYIASGMLVVVVVVVIRVASFDCCGFSIMILVVVVLLFKSVRRKGFGLEVAR